MLSISEGNPDPLYSQNSRKFHLRLARISFPLSLLIKILEEEGIKTRAYILGVQPKNIGLGENLSPEVRRSAEILISILRHII
jgi:Ni,Fe-hydrogenase maturation factor